MKKLLLLLWAIPCLAQTHDFPALDTTNVYTGTNIFNGPVTFGQSFVVPTITATTINTTGPGFTMTFQCQTAPSGTGLPPLGSILYYCDSGTGLFTTLKHDGSSANPGGSAWGGVTSGTNSNSGNFIASGNTWDFTGVTQIKLRAGAGLTTSANGGIGYDTTNNNWHVWQNGADSFLFSGSAAGTYTVNDCTKIASTNPLTFADSGGACGGSGSASPIVFTSVQALSSTTNPQFFGTGVVVSATEAQMQVAMPRSGTVSNLQCRSTNALSSSQTETFTVRKGAASIGAITSADTTVTCTLNSTNTNGCSDGTHNFTVAAGDVLDIKTAPANSPAPGISSCTIELQ